MVETVQLETFTADEAEAKALAAKHLESLNTPAANFVWVRRAVAQRSADYPDLVAAYGGDAKPKAAKASEAPEDEHLELAAASSPRKTTPAGRIGA